MLTLFPFFRVNNSLTAFTLKRMFRRVLRRLATPRNAAFLQSAPRPSTFDLPAISANIGKLVIACPNEWNDMTVGRITSEWEGGVVIVDDFANGKVMTVFAPYVEYSEPALKELAELNPYERYNRVAKHSSVALDLPRSGTADLLWADYQERVFRALIDGR